MFKYYVMILLSSQANGAARKSKANRRFTDLTEDLFTSADAEELRANPLQNLENSYEPPVRQFPGIKLKAAKTAQRFSFELLVDNMLQDYKDHLTRHRQSFRSGINDLHVKLQDSGSNSSGYFNATDGYVEDYTTMWRYGRAELTKCKPNLTLRVLVTVHVLRPCFDNYVLCVDDVTNRGRVVGQVAKNTVQVVVNFTLRPRCVYHLCAVRLDQFGTARYNLKGLTRHYSWWWVTRAVSNSITRHFVDNYRHEHENTIFTLFDEAFKRINPCGYFHYNPNEW